MALDDQNTITPLQSGTIRAALQGAIALAIAMIFRILGKVVDNDLIGELSRNGADLAFMIWALWCYWKVYKGRLNATETIVTKKDEKP